jgi:DNA-binding CsgD family transcriptional regulator
VQLGAWPLVGRNAELERFHATLTGGRLRGIVLAGPSGSGKTSLARTCVDEAAALGYSPEWVYATPATTAIPLGAFAPMLPTMATVSSPDRLLHEAHQALQARSQSAAPLLAIDDAHLLDDLSASLVHQLATAGAMAVVLTVRTGEVAPDPLVALWKDAHVERLDVGPLRRKEVHELVDALLEGPVDMAVSHELWRVSGGNPLYLRELFRAAREDGSLCEVDGTWRLVGPLRSSERLGELVEGRLGALDDPGREALELVAVGEPLGLDHLESHVSLDLISDLEARGLVRVHSTTGGDLVQLAHPVYGEVVRGGIPGLRVRSIQRRLADSLERLPSPTEHDRERVARWRLETGGTLSVDALLQVARRAMSRFDVAFAERCARQACSQEPGTQSAIVLADALLMARSCEEAEHVLAGIEDDIRTDEDLAAYTVLRGENLYRGLGRREEAVALNRRAESRVRSPAARGRIVAHRASFAGVDGRPLAAMAELVSVLESDAPPIEAVLVGAMSCMFMGRFADAARLTQRGEVTWARDHTFSIYDASLPRIYWLHSLALQGRLTEAVERAAAAHEAALSAGSGFARGWYGWVLGNACLLQGKPATAERWFRDSLHAMTLVRGNPRTRTALTGLVRCAALHGDAVTAERHLEAAGATPGWPLFRGEEIQARAWCRVATGDVASASTLLADGARDLGRDGMYVNEAACLHDLVRLGGATPEVAARLGKLASTAEGALIAAQAAHAAAVVAEDWLALAEVSERFQAMGAVLVAAESAGEAGRRAAADGHAREATALGRRAADLAAHCEGARTPGLPPPVDSLALTPRERDIAALAAQDLSSKEIADRLFLSRRTVDNTLQRVYGKLGVSRRSDLAAALHDAGPQVPSTPST